MPLTSVYRSEDCVCSDSMHNSVLGNVSLFPCIDVADNAHNLGSLMLSIDVVLQMPFLIPQRTKERVESNDINSSMIVFVFPLVPFLFLVLLTCYCA
jgi:hypothetical protein